MVPGPSVRGRARRAAAAAARRGPRTRGPFGQPPRGSTTARVHAGAPPPPPPDRTPPGAPVQPRKGGKGASAARSRPWPAPPRGQTNRRPRGEARETGGGLVGANGRRRSRNPILQCDARICDASRGASRPHLSGRRGRLNWRLGGLAGPAGAPPAVADQRGALPRVCRILASQLGHWDTRLRSAHTARSVPAPCEARCLLPVTAGRLSEVGRVQCQGRARGLLRRWAVAPPLKRRRAADGATAASADQPSPDEKGRTGGGLGRHLASRL